MNQKNRIAGENEMQEILHERSIALSRPEKKKRPDTVQCLLVTLGVEEYALKLDAVVEIIKEINVTHIPGSPDFIEGVMNLRGEILSVVDLAKAIALTVTAGSKKDRRIIKIHMKGIDAGLLVDGISGIYEFTLDTIEPPLLTMKKTDVEHLEGEIKTEGKLIGILDLTNILRMRDDA